MSGSEQTDNHENQITIEAPPQINGAEKQEENNKVIESGESPQIDPKMREKADEIVKDVFDRVFKQ